MTAIAAPLERVPPLPLRFFGLLPGIALLAAIGLAGKLLEQSLAAYGKANQIALPNIEYVLWAILIGLAVANTVGVPRIFRRGRRDLRILAQARHRVARGAFP